MVQRNEECVRVVVRCRPMSEKETAQGHKKVIQIDSKVSFGANWSLFGRNSDFFYLLISDWLRALTNERQLENQMNS